jgi:hypothetical protein
VDVLVNNAAVQRGWREPINDPAGHNDRKFSMLLTSTITRLFRISILMTGPDE